MADTIAVMNAGPDRADRRPRRALRVPGHHVRRQLPRPVQPAEGRGRRTRRRAHRRRRQRQQARRASGPGPVVPTGRGWVGVRPEKVFLAGSGSRERRREQPARRRPGHRRQLHRREHAVPRADAVGPGAHGLRAEQRSPRELLRGRLGRPRTGRRRTRSCSTPTRTRTPATSPTPHCREPSSEHRGSGGSGQRRPSARAGGAAASARRRPATCSCCPGMLWLVVFFLVPTVQLAAPRSTTPTARWITGLRDDLVVLELPARAAVEYQAPFLRSMLYAGVATALALLLGYPLAYAIAFKAGRWKNLMLVLVIAPFFTSFLVRTLAWKIDPVRQRLRRGAPCRPRCILGHRRSAAGHAGRGGHRPDLQLPAVHGAAALREPGEDRPAAARGRAATCTPTRFTTFRKVTLPLSLPGRGRRHAADLHPGRRRLHQRRVARDAEARSMIGQRHRQPVPARARLPDRGRAAPFILMLVIVVMVLVYVRRAGTEELL